MLWQCTIITALWVFCILIFNNYIFNHRPLSSINSIFQVQVRYYCSSSSMTQHTTAHTRMVYRTTNKKSKKERRRRRGERRGKKKRKNHILLSFYNIIRFILHLLLLVYYFFFCLFLDVFFYTNLVDCFVVVQLSIDNVFHFKRSF